MSGFLSQLRDFDAYPKTLADFRVKSVTGALVTVVAGVIMTLLFVAELKDFLKIEVQPELKVDTERDVKMEIYLDIVYPAMPCSYMHIDVLDVLGGQQLDIAHYMFKTRLDLYGVEIDTQKH